MDYDLFSFPLPNFLVAIIYEYSIDFNFSDYKYFHIYIQWCIFKKMLSKMTIKDLKEVIFGNYHKGIGFTEEDSCH